MEGSVAGTNGGAEHPVQVRIEPALEDRNQLTSAFRIILAVPHLLLVGGPVAACLTWSSRDRQGLNVDWGAGGGVLGAVASVGAIIAWFSIVFTGRHPRGLWNLSAYYLRWRVRAVAYTALLRDEYPPFGEGEYPAGLELSEPDTPRDRLTVGFRVILAIPHVIAIWFLGIVWAFTSVFAWFSIILTARYPAALYSFGEGVLRWLLPPELLAR